MREESWIIKMIGNSATNVVQKNQPPPPSQNMSTLANKLILDCT